LNTIYSLIHRNLKRTLLVSLNAAGFVLVIYSFLSFKQTESQAVRFVTNHVAALAQAGVNSQNVNEIDKEIGRFVQAWKETQDLELRVDIFLDGRLIAHGGQLQPFRYFHSNSEDRISLPSGQDLRINIEIGLLNFLLSGILLLLALATFIFGVFFVLMVSMRKSIKSITSPLEIRIDWLKKIAQDLPSSVHASDKPQTTNEVQEIDELGSSINTLLSQIILLERRLSKTNFDRGQTKMARQVAHSIKGIIGTLDLKVGSAHALSASEKREIGECINSLRDVSKGFLGPKTAKIEVTEMELAGIEPLHIFPVINSLLTTKRIQFQNKKNIDLVHFEPASSFATFCTLSSGDLQTVLANLVDNAAEAIHDHGKISVRCYRKNKFLEIIVEDTGQGVPEHLLPLLMQEEATFGKTDGNGIGLAHVKEMLKSHGGSISISSIEGRGTTVRITLPSTKPPQGFLTDIGLWPDVTLILVDDDSLIPKIWQQRLLSNGIQIKSFIHLDLRPKPVPTLG
jgi:signal transduction histidine kinase